MMYNVDNLGSDPQLVNGFGLDDPRSKFSPCFGNSQLLKVPPTILDENEDKNYPPSHLHATGNALPSTYSLPNK